MKPTFSKDANYGDRYGAAMSITDPHEAQEYLEGLVDWHVEKWMKDWNNPDREEAERIERANLGYFAGYYDAETYECVMRLFDTSHPVFGKTPPAQEEAFRLGYERGKQRRK
jgi:hypothetical protein